MGIGAPAQLRDEATFWRRLTAVIVVSGLLITTMVAMLQLQAAQRERDLRFEAEASRVAVLLEERIGERLSSFGSAINFISATHPGPLDEYEAFMRNEVEQTQSEDPGVMFFEFVNLDEIDELEAREAAIGNDFTVTLFPGPTEERVVLTRLAYESQLFGVSLLGLDATGLRGSLIPDDFGSQDFELYVLESDDIFDFISADVPVEEDFGRYSVVMLATVRNGAGSVLGWVTSIMTIDNAIGLGTISGETDLAFTLSVADFDEAVGTSSGWGAATGGESPLATRRMVETAGLEWTVDAYGSADFGGSVGLFDQRAVWFGGVFLTFLAVMIAARRQVVRRSLDSARFELEHARTVASTDSLTGLLNRNGLIDAARLLPAEQPATLFFIDLDGFKSVNDTEGHERGDQVLRLVANELRSIFRSDDLVSRFGGDEYVVFARRSAPKKFVETASNRITSAVSSIDARVTCSIGVASRAPGSEVDVKDMVRLADGAMYSAKRAGGDRYELAA